MIQAKQVAGIPSIPTDPNGIVYTNPTGTALVADPKLKAAPLDPYQRPQIWDNRSNPANLPPNGAVFRQGSWGIDGDPTSQAANGFVTYGANALNAGPDNAAGAYFFCTSQSFGVAQIVPGVGGGNLFYTCGFENGNAFQAPGIGAPPQLNGLILNDDSAFPQFYVERLTGKVQIGNPDPTHGGNGVIYLNQSGSFNSGAPVQMSYATKGMTVRLSQYGAALGAGVSGTIAFFRSRSNTIAANPLGSVNVGDTLMNLTSIGVCADNASIPLASIFQVIAEAVPAVPASVVPKFSFELAYLGTNSHRPVWSMSGLTGDFIMAPRASGVPNPPAQPSEGRILVRDAQASAGVSVNAMQGLAVLVAGGTVTVPNTLITANTRIAYFFQAGQIPLGQLHPANVVVGVSFDLVSNNVLDAGCNVFWQLWEPAP